MPRKPAKPAFEATIELWERSRLKPYTRNNKRHPSGKIEKLALAISEFGFDQPIVATPDGEIIKGHARYEASGLLKLAKVPVVVRSDLTPEQIKAARIADNQATEGSEYDFEAMAIELQELADADFDLNLTLLDDPDELLSSLDLIDPDDAGDDKAKRLKKKTGEVKPVITCDQVPILEKAISATGQKNRGHALIEICKFYLEGNGVEIPEG